MLEPVREEWDRIGGWVIEVQRRLLVGGRQGGVTCGIRRVLRIGVAEKPIDIEALEISRLDVGERRGIRDPGARRSWRLFVRSAWWFVVGTGRRGVGWGATPRGFRTAGRGLEQGIVLLDPEDLQPSIGRGLRLDGGIPGRGFLSPWKISQGPRRAERGTSGGHDRGRRRLAAVAISRSLVTTVSRRGAERSSDQVDDPVVCESVPLLPREGP